MLVDNFHRKYYVTCALRKLLQVKKILKLDLITMIFDSISTEIITYKKLGLKILNFISEYIFADHPLKN